MPDSVELSYAECRQLLTTGAVGRVAVCTPSGPRIIPVNYAVMGDAVVFRTTPYSILGTYARNASIAFEVDHIDATRKRGWSVVALGHAYLVDDLDELQHIREASDPAPWANGNRWQYVRLAWQELSGRQVGRDWDPSLSASQG